MLTNLFSFLPLAQASPETAGTTLPDPGPSPLAIFSDASVRRVDLLNHPEKLAQVLTDLNIVWAVIFMVLGGICVFNGYRWHKLVIVLLSGLMGVWAGVEYGGTIGAQTIVATSLGLLAAMLAWPLLRYAASVFGGLAGAFAGANIWTAIGQPPEQHYVGAIVGLIIVGMLAFLAFRGVVVILTTVGGANNAMLAMDGAINAVNSARATLGAVQSRFENAIGNIQVT
ncbi:MAG: flagellin, partial [Phycisphaerales bacterium]